MTGNSNSAGTELARFRVGPREVVVRVPPHTDDQFGPWILCHVPANGDALPPDNAVRLLEERDGRPLIVEWSPDVPARFSETEIREYRSGRRAAAEAMRESTGRRVGIKELGP